MEGFTIVDAGVLAVALLSGVLAYSRGLVREMFAILGWAGAGVFALTFAKPAEPLIKQIPGLDKLLENCELSTLAAFFSVFAVGLIIVSIFTPLFSSLIQRSFLAGADRALGFLFGVVRGVVLILVAFVLYDRLFSTKPIPAIEGSRSIKIFASLEQDLNAKMPSDAPTWVLSQYNALVGDCAPPAGGTTSDITTESSTQDTGGAKTISP